MSDTLQSEPVPRSAASLDDTSTRRHYPPMVLQPNPYSGRLLSFDPLPHRASIYFFEFTHENPNAEYVWHIMPGFSQMRASSYMHVYDDNEDPNNRNRSRAPIVLRDAHSYETISQTDRMAVFTMRGRAAFVIDCMQGYSAEINACEIDFFKVYPFNPSARVAGQSPGPGSSRVLIGGITAMPVIHNMNLPIFRETNELPPSVARMRQTPRIVIPTQPSGLSAHPERATSHSGRNLSSQVSLQASQSVHLVAYSLAPTQRSTWTRQAPMQMPSTSSAATATAQPNVARPRTTTARPQPVVLKTRAKETPARSKPKTNKTNKTKAPATQLEPTPIRRTGTTLARVQPGSAAAARRPVPAPISSPDSSLSSEKDSDAMEMSD